MYDPSLTLIVVAALVATTCCTFYTYLVDRRLSEKVQGSGWAAILIAFIASGFSAVLRIVSFIAGALALAGELYCNVFQYQLDALSLRPAVSCIALGALGMGLAAWAIDSFCARTIRQS